MSHDFSVTFIALVRFPLGPATRCRILRSWLQHPNANKDWP